MVTLSDTAVDNSVVVLGKGSKEDVVFNWVTTDWSECSSSCRNGMRFRNSVCTVTLKNNSVEVEDSFCSDVEMPKLRMRCGTTDCAKWVANEWSPCEKSQCFNPSIGK